MCSPRYFICFLLTVSALCAQRVRWEPAGGHLPRGQPSQLVLVFENCEPTGTVDLPTIDNLTIGQPTSGQQSSTQIVNGRVTSTRLVYLGYPVTPLGDDPIVVPDFTVQTDEGALPVAGVSFEVREATIGDTEIPVTYAANSTISLATNEIWAGEVIPITYLLTVAQRFNYGIASTPEWEPAPLIVEEWVDPQQGTINRGGEQRKAAAYRTRGYIRSAGTHTLPSIRQLVNIAVPSSSFFRQRTEQFNITSDAPQITVKPLPADAPDAFDGAVGSFELTSTVVPEVATVGEPVTWTLKLEGTGNWPDVPGLPGRAVSRDFRVVQPQASRVNVDGKIFEASITEDVVLIPSREGDYTLGPVEWAYFDPATGEYQTVTTPEVQITITPGAPVAPPPLSTAMEGEVTPADATTNRSETPPVLSRPTPDSPPALPRDPLPGSASINPPLLFSELIWAVVGLAFFIPLGWLFLSAMHAVRHDSGRAARAARRRLKSTITELQGAVDRGERDNLLLKWQRDVAILWGSAQAVPATSLFAGHENWSALWRDSNEALFTAAGILPEDWVRRAETALRAKRAPMLPIHRCVYPAHLFPSALVVVLITLTVGPPEAQATPIEDYAKGDFDQAEQAWRETLESQPTDWVAHHNLSLALAQQNQWAEAGAHASIAFVQNPRDPAVRWHLGYTLERAGYTPPTLGRFAEPGWREKLARQASPAQWQMVLVLGAGLGVLCIWLVLLHAYGKWGRHWKLVSWSGGTLAVACLATAVAGIQTYGLAAHPDAVMTWQPGTLRSVPTDLDTEQQTTPLAAGSLATVQREFLGWRQLEFRNGQTGWVRAEDIVRIWQAD